MCPEFGDCRCSLAPPVRDCGEAVNRTWLHADIEVFREPLDDSEPFGERRAAFEPAFEALIEERPEGVGYPVVVFDQSDAKPRSPVTIRSMSSNSGSS